MDKNCSFFSDQIHSSNLGGRKLTKIRQVVLIVTFSCLAINLMTMESAASQVDEEKILRETKGWVFPSDGVVTDIFLSRGGAHKGIDIAGALGSPIYAVDKGVVVKSYQSESYGNVIMLKHDNGYETVYAHLHAPFKNVGEVVEKGEAAWIDGEYRRVYWRSSAF